MSVGSEILVYMEGVLAVSPVIKVFLLYFIALGIGFFSKMSFDSLMLVIALATIINGIWIIGNSVMIAIFLIVAGIVIGVAVLRMPRH